MLLNKCCRNLERHRWRDQKLVTIKRFSALTKMLHRHVVQSIILYTKLLLLQLIQGLKTYRPLACRSQASRCSPRKRTLTRLTRLQRDQVPQIVNLQQVRNSMEPNLWSPLRKNSLPLKSQKLEAVVVLNLFNMVNCNLRNYKRLAKLNKVPSWAALEVQVHRTPSVDIATMMWLQAWLMQNPKTRLYWPAKAKLAEFQKLHPKLNGNSPKAVNWLSNDNRGLIRPQFLMCIKFYF